MTVKALNASGEVLTETTVSLKSIKKPLYHNYLPIKKISIDKNNTLIVNDEPVFPMAIYQGVNNIKALKQIRNQGFNVVQLWGSDITKFKRNMDLAQQAGLMVFCVTKMPKNEKP